MGLSLSKNSLRFQIQHVILKWVSEGPDLLVCEIGELYILRLVLAEFLPAIALAIPEGVKGANNRDPA